MFNIENYNPIEKQATINIGTIGHVAHGKSTTIRAISGKSTLKYKSELERNITIKLGYANAKIYECNCERPECYSSTPLKCLECNSDKRLIRHVSFVDCPGHEVLMSTMLNGSAIMNSALLLIAADEDCPQPQTLEHLEAFKILGIDNFIVLQSKIDLISKEQALEQYKIINLFLQSNGMSAPVVPLSGQMNVNVDAVLDFIVNYVKEPELNYDEDSKMIIIRSFDINKPGTLYSKVQGGVIGGSIISGSLRVGEEIEIRPGKIIEENGEVKCVPFITEIKSLYAESTNLDIALPGGLIGVGTDIDPSECKNDMMVGSVVGKKGKLPPVFKKIKIKYNLLEKPVGSDVDSLDEESVVTVNVSSASSVVNIIEITDDYGYLELLKPICANVGEKLSISIKEGKSIRLVGYGNIIEGEDTEIIYE